MAELNRITVLGAGVLGGQIAWHSAFKGKTVAVYDISSEALDKCRAAHDQYAAVYPKDVGATDGDIAATRERLSYTTELAAAVGEADLVIEAVPEIPKVKTEVYESMAGLLPEHTLLATNSSTLLARDFAAATGRPEKFCALHFANLIWIMNVVEIMAHPATAESTLTAITEFAIEIGMLPIPVQKEQNGYVLNTWLVPLLNAAQTLVTNGVSTPEDVDRTYMKVNPGCHHGPVRLSRRGRHEDGVRHPDPLGTRQRRQADARKRGVHQDQLARQGPDGHADRTGVLPLSRTPPLRIRSFSRSPTCRRCRTSSRAPSCPRTFYALATSEYSPRNRNVGH